MWFIGVEVEQETSAPPPKKNPESAPDILHLKKSITFDIPENRQRFSRYPYQKEPAHIHHHMEVYPQGLLVASNVTNSKMWYY